MGITLRWELLAEFYFTKRFGFTILTVATAAPYNMHAYLVIPNDEIKKQVMKILVEHIVYIEKPSLNFTDKAIHWLSYLIPDDDTEEDDTTKKHIDKKYTEESKLMNVKHSLESFFQKQRDSFPSHRSSSPKK